jgi:hypothetical protein
MRYLRFERNRIYPGRLDGGVGMINRPVRVLSKKPSHKTDAFFPTDNIAEGAQLVIG